MPGGLVVLHVATDDRGPKVAVLTVTSVPALGVLGRLVEEGGAVGESGASLTWAWGESTSRPPKGYFVRWIP